MGNAGGNGTVLRGELIKIEKSRGIYRYFILYLLGI